jgi:hypothetical protein
MAMRRTHRAQRTPDHSLAPLLVRAGAARTLGSAIACLALLLLCVGAYLLVKVMRYPLDAQPIEILGGAVMIALAANMLFVLFEPRPAVRHVHHRSAAPLHGARAVARPPLSPPLSSLTRVDTQSELPFASGLGKEPRTGATTGD